MMGQRVTTTRARPDHGARCSWPSWISYAATAPFNVRLWPSASENHVRSHAGDEGNSRRLYSRLVVDSDPFLTLLRPLQTLYTRLAAERLFDFFRAAPGIGTVGRVIGNTARTCSAHIRQNAVAYLGSGRRLSHR